MGSMSPAEPWKMPVVTFLGIRRVTHLLWHLNVMPIIAWWMERPMDVKAETSTSRMALWGLRCLMRHCACKAITQPGTDGTSPHGFVLDAAFPQHPNIIPRDVFTNFIFRRHLLYIDKESLELQIIFDYLLFFLFKIWLHKTIYLISTQGTTFKSSRHSVTTVCIFSLCLCVRVLFVYSGFLPQCKDMQMVGLG